MGESVDKGLSVICHAGYRGEEEPRSLSLGDRAVQIIEVLDRWLAPDHRYFKCLGSDGNTYILRHDVMADRWELTMFAQGTTNLSLGATDRDVAQ